MTSDRKTLIAQQITRSMKHGRIEPNRVERIELNDDGMNVRIDFILKPLHVIDFVKLSIDFTPEA